MQLSARRLTFVFLLLSCYGLSNHGRVLAQFLPPPPPCTTATPPPPELRPLDNDANLLTGCSLPEERSQKSAISETTAHRLALCNSFCTNRVLSGTYALTSAQKQTLPGYPVWLVATQSYLLSEDGTTTDCLLGDNQNGCNTDCTRFTPPSPLFGAAMPGGYKEILDCKLGCRLQFEDLSSPVTTCRDSCQLNCQSVACQCNFPIFGGDGCEVTAVRPCGRFCNADSCQEGCSDAKSYSTNTTYPSSANPTQAPVVTQIGNGTRYMINIANSIPSGHSGDVGFSTLIVRVLDASSTTQNDYTYYVLENGFEFDLAPFACRRVEVSFAVATQQMNISSYSAATTVELSTGTLLPEQLNTFNFTVEQDTRSGFYQNLLIHLTWDPPQNIEFAEGYTILLSSMNNQGRCKSATYTLTNNTLTSYTVRSNTSSDPPLSRCGYRIQVEVNPRSGEAASQTTSTLSYIYPNENDNVQSNCTVILDRNSIRYDVDMFVTFDELFTPAIISVIQNIQVSSTEIDARSNPIPGTTTSGSYPLDSGTERGPVTLYLPYNDLTQVEAGHGYLLSMFIRWTIGDTNLPAIRASCNVFNVGPIPPDPVEDIIITFGEAFSDNNLYLITLRYNWTAPSFQGEGINGYEVWLQKEQAPLTTERNLQQLAAESRSAQTQANFQSSDGNFTLYFQLRAVGKSPNVRSPWSQPIIFNVSSLERPAPEQIEDNEFSVTTFMYSVPDTNEQSDNLTVTVELNLNVVVPTISNGTVGHIQVYVGRVPAAEDDDEIAANLRTEAITVGEGMTAAIQPSFSGVRIYGFGTRLYLQVRGRSLFNSIETTGTWSNPKILTVQQVPPPTNVNVTDIINVRRTLDNSQIQASLTLSLSWVPPVGFESLSGYEVIISRQAVERFTTTSAVSDSETATVSANHFNSTSALQFTNLVLNVTTLEELQLSLQMRTLASDVIKGGGEWSTPPVTVTLPAQPADVTDDAFNITSFTYRPTTESTGQLRVLAEVELSLALPEGTRVDVYIGPTMISRDDSTAPFDDDTVSAGGTGRAASFLDTIQEINDQEIFIQVRVSAGNIVGPWSDPKRRHLTPVFPPTDIRFLSTNSRFRRSLNGSTLIVEAININMSWLAPPTSPAFIVTEYDVLYTDTVVSGYIEIPPIPSGQGQIVQFESSSLGGSFSGDMIMFSNSSFNDDVTLFLQMRTRADILPSSHGGNWSEAELVRVPTQPENMTDENFNVTSYEYSLETSDDGMRPMLNVSLNMSLLTPPIAGGQIKELHVNVGTEKLSAVANPNFIPINVLVEDKTQNHSLSVALPLQPEASLPGTDLYVQVRGMSTEGALGDWAEAERFVLPSVPSPENITAKVNSAKEENEVLLRLEVILQWDPPADLSASTGVRQRRQADTRDTNDIVAYEVLISTKNGTGIDYAEVPSRLTGLFSMRFGVSGTTNVIFPVDFRLATSDDLVNDTLYLQMRTVTTLTSSGGEWSEPMTLMLEFPPPSQASLTAVIAGTTTPLAIIIAIVIIVIVTILVFLAYRTKKIKDEYQVATGEVNWDYDWNADMPTVGMVEGKEPLLDEWEIPTTEVIVEDHLGEGAFGYVFKGVIRGPLRNPKLSSQLKQTIGLPVAIKLLKDTATRKERSDFLTEIEMMKKISEGYNNHIVNLVGCVTIQEPLCLITEYVPHGDLLDYLRNQRKKNAARRRQERILRMHSIRAEANREYYEEMIRQAKISQSAQSEDSDLGRSTTGSGYAELVALREMDSGQGASASEPVVNGAPAVGVKETEIDVSTEGVAIVGVAVGGVAGMAENSSEVQLLREESTESSEGGVPGSRLMENGVLNPISEEAEEGDYPEEKAAPYIEAKNEYSHLDPRPAESAITAAAPEGHEGEGLNTEDEELLRALMQTEQIGELEANDLMQFAYQIATGMEYLASLNIVHRDLACRNILVGEGKSLKITDFGLSREVEEVYVKKTKGRLPLKWMAIESIDAREFTTASDVWSYGVVLWEIGTLGGFPYPAIPNQDLLTMLKQGHRLEKPDNCAPEVYEIMLECWQEHASDRPTFSELRNKFSSLLLANVDDPYMVLEVDDAKAYYNVSEEESSEQRESVSSNDSDASLKKKGPPKKPVWAKPSNPYVETPALSKDVAITVEEETPQENDAGVAASTPQQQNGHGLGVPVTGTDAFDPYIKMRSSPASTGEPTDVPETTHEQINDDLSSQPPQVSMSLPVEHSMGLSLSLIGSEKPIHQPVKQTRSNPYVDDPGSRQLLDVEESNGVEIKLPMITENGGTENILEREQ